jgi:benzoyl-CoA reductase/2-hydroxyglutaryl-CoA dehydratase subunit BcrC/BadD/HgdB
MIELLTLCGFEANELDSELPRIKRAFKHLGITSTDIERGKQRLCKYFDIELQGVQKAVGLCIKDVVNTVLAREEGKNKILYGFMSGGFEVIGSMLVTRANDIHAANIAATMQFVLGGIFDKIVPILEAAERQWLKAGKVCHCGNVKTMVGLLALDLIPKPDLLVTSGQLCDTAPKTLDMLHELYNVPVYYFDTCQDREFKEYPESKRIVELSAISMRQLAHKVEDVVGFEITDDMMWDAINARNDLRQALRNIQNLMDTADPPPISTTHEMLWSSLGTLPWSIAELRKPAAALAALQEELQIRVSEVKGAVKKGAPRILSLLPQHYTDPRWEHLLREVGIAAVSSELGFFPLHGKRYIDFNEEKPEDPYQSLAFLLHASLAQNLGARIAIIIEVCKRLRVDGVLGKFHVGCRINAGDALLIKNAIISELGIPVLLLEWEGFDPRIYKDDQLRKQLELFRSILIANKKS